MRRRPSRTGPSVCNTYSPRPTVLCLHRARWSLYAAAPALSPEQRLLANVTLRCAIISFCTARAPHNRCSTYQECDKWKNLASFLDPLPCLVRSKKIIGCGQWPRLCFLARGCEKGLHVCIHRCVWKRITFSVPENTGSRKGWQGQ